MNARNRHRREMAYREAMDAMRHLRLCVSRLYWTGKAEDFDTARKMVESGARL